MLGWFKKKFSKKKEEKVEQEPLAQEPEPQEDSGAGAEEELDQPRVDVPETERREAPGGESGTAPVEEAPASADDDQPSEVAAEDAPAADEKSGNLPEDVDEVESAPPSEDGQDLVELLAEEADVAAEDAFAEAETEESGRESLELDIDSALFDEDEVAPALDFVPEEDAVPEEQEAELSAPEDVADGDDEILDLAAPEPGDGREPEQGQEEALRLDVDEGVVEQVISSLEEENEPEIIDQPLEELLADEQPGEAATEPETVLPEAPAEGRFDREGSGGEVAAGQVEAADEMAPDDEEGTLQSVEELLADEPVQGEDGGAGAEGVATRAVESVTAEKPARKSLFQRLMERLGKTRQGLVYRLDAIFLGKKEIDEDLLDELEEVLITADLGVATTMDLLDTARRQVKRNELSDPRALKKVLRDRILEYLLESDQPAELVMPESGPFVIMVVGVNGVGKTTTIGKIANKFKKSGQSVLLVAADTFRAAAIDQLKIWADRVGADIIARKPGADPSSVVWDGLDHGVKKNFDAIIIDTAGRLHTSVNLMEELKKIRRVMAKKVEGAPHEVLLVLDATTGQNGISQAKLFGEAVGVSGLALTKLDGTAKGGIVANVCRELKIPVRFIGIGEQMDDLRDFDPHEFVDALFAEEGT